MADPPLPLGTKILYGLGQAAEGIKNFSFEMFLFFYFSRVLGLTGTLAGASLAVALVVDAVTDPLAGSLSDNFHHRWGRRHPFMYASALPLALSYGMLFSPPAGLGQAGLFLWLTAGAILVRTSMTLYFVPHLSLGAELSEHYEERTRIVGIRVLFSALGMVAVAVGAKRVFFHGRPGFDNGQLDATAYPPFGWTFGTMMLVVIVTSALGTHRCIPRLPKAPDRPERAGIGRAARELREALENRSFRYFMIGVFAFFVARGVQLTLNLDLLTYFWDLKERALTVPLAMVIGLLVGIPFWARVSQVLDKRPTLLIGIASFSALVLSAPLLRLAGLWPSPSSEWYVRGVVWTSALAAFGGAAGLVSAGSMVADMADEHELATGRRQEGIFFGALSFAVKSSSGFGHLIAGLSLDAVGFPRQVRVEEVPEDLRRMLAWIFCGFLLVLGTVSVATARRYALTRERHAELARELGRRRSARATPP